MEGNQMTTTHAAPDPGRGVYGISVAAELVGMGSQTLRLYEHRGLLEPARSGGGTRRYSGEDLARLRRIADLVAAGVNLTGVAMVLDLEDANALLQADLDAVRQPIRTAPSGHSRSSRRKRTEKPDEPR
jgi:MerR family transcriptional regulator, heat shock protein HspR